MHLIALPHRLHCGNAQFANGERLINFAIDCKFDPVLCPRSPFIAPQVRHPLAEPYVEGTVAPNSFARFLTA